MKNRNSSYTYFVVVACGLFGVASTLASPLKAQTVPSALISPPAKPVSTGSNGEVLPGSPRYHDPAPYDIDDHVGYKQIFDGKTLNQWNADPSIWRVENGLMVGET
ncbi:MAG: hypothetical protein ACRYFU_15760, partial [Janthinobacterium lividum]